MRKRFWVCLALLLLIPGFMFATSCAKKQVVSEPAVTAEEEDAEARRLAAERERQEKLHPFINGLAGCMQAEIFC